MFAAGSPTGMYGSLRTPNGAVDDLNLLANPLPMPKPLPGYAQLPPVHEGSAEVRVKW